MSTNFASLGIEVNSSSAVKAADDLDKLVTAAEGAEKAVDGLGKASTSLADTGKKVAQAEAEAAQGIDKSTGASERQADARRKSGASATSEIAIISQLDKAMSSNISSMESLVQAEGLLERARKGGLVTIEQQEAYQERLGKSYDKIEKAEIKEVAQKQRLIDAENRQIEALKRTVNGIDPVTAKLAKLEAQEKAAHEAFRVGAINADRYNEALAKIGKDRAGMGEAASAFDKLKLGTRQAQENVVQLGNALSSGDWGSGVRAVAQLGAGAGSAAIGFAAIAAPIALAAGALAVLTNAYYQGSKEAQEYNKSLILTGNYAGTNASELAEMARQISATVGTTGAAADVLASLAGNGKIASASFVEISEAALAMEKATGKSVDATVAEFVKIADDPVAAAKSLNDQYHFLTASVYAQIVALKEQGDEIGASKLLTDSYADAVKGRAGEIVQNLSLVEKAWLAIRGETAKTLDALKNVGRDQDDLLRITEITQKLAYLQSTLGTGFEDGDAKKRMESLQDELNLLQDKQAALKDNAKFDSDQTRIQKEGLEAEIKLKAISDSNLTNAEKRNKLIKDYQRSVDDLRKANPDSPLVKPDYVAKTIQNIKDKNKDPAVAAGSVDLTGFNDAKNQLTAILAEYSNAQKQLDAAQKAGLISQAEYAQKREGLIGNERDEVAAAYEAEIAALEAVKNKSSTTAAQRIQLDQKIADARTAMVKAQKAADSQQEVLATNEKGRLDKQTYAVSQYVAALGQQQKALALAGQRAVNGVGQGDRQNALSGELNSQQDRFAQQSLELENQRSDPSRNMDPEEFKQKSQALADANKAATDQIRQNYADVEAAQGDWTKGATSAWANYLDSARDIAGQTRSLFTNAFSSMEDSIVNFAMTGKASFGDFAKSILADMARIAARQASSALLGSLVGAAASYFTGGSGSSGFASGSAGAASSAAGASQAGYTNVDFSGYRAAGGPVAPNSLYEVNELGPELYNEGGRSFLMTGANGGSVTPLTSGAGPGIAALGGSGGGSGGDTYNFPVAVSVQTGGADSPANNQQASADLGKGVQQVAQSVVDRAIAKELQPGGEIWKRINGR
ncbi:phage tail tape measure protein [Pseudomonas sp. 10S4]|uniref:phage tail tape measure protein n=1 Tax=Pseudomonas sp. 10S4 TaxID=3048583 RepID=UPI002AC9D9E8|nr:MULTISPECIES: phage tail tape measure protein [unclassified Pseudomonas]MEB0226252.1 phage tail tape measure protein [Pseudomonas sp. 5S1]MEB0294927.1 phage tail tape measure protein [Pseudomonas sp. 10S4]WPX18129.1 phage tail tape measure protein [Pseudomonas sp. 10S4]